jgi:hypothetical protein
MTPTKPLIKLLERDSGILSQYGFRSVAVYTDSEDIAFMFRHKNMKPFDPVPTHNEVLSSEQFGHLITMTDMADGSQLFSVSEERDEKWFAAHQPKHWLMP